MSTAVCELIVAQAPPFSTSSTAASCTNKRTSALEQCDRETIRQAQAGDAAAFERVYRIHSRRVYGLCFRMTGNPTLAEDLTQDIFLQVFRKIQTFRAESAFSTWLYRLAVNVVLMRRRIKRLNETPLDRPSETEAGALPPRELGTVDQRLSGVVDRVNLRRALKALPRGYRQIFVLHDVMGYEHHEIAQALGCSVGTSKSQLHKARMRLRKLLRNERTNTQHLKTHLSHTLTARNTI